MAGKPDAPRANLRANPWPNPWALPDAKAPADLPDLGTLMAGPLSLMRAWADVNRATVNWLPATWLVAASPFFWATPFWVGALMSGGGAHPRGGVTGSTATPREAAAAAKPVVGKPAPGKAPARTRRPVARA